jgi:RNA polymerase sigma-70 factor (ECF subfamily)
VFLQVHRALPTLRDDDRLHAWVYQTTRRAIADFYRAPSHTREVPAGAAVDLAPEVAAATNEDADGRALQELSVCLKPLISGLGPADQEALRLVEFEGVTQVEAAGRLGLSVSGMKSRVQRARLHLRTALDECCRIALDRRGGVIDYEARTDRCGTCQEPPEAAAGEPSQSAAPVKRPR